MSFELLNFLPTPSIDQNNWFHIETTPNNSTSFVKFVFAPCIAILKMIISQMQSSLQNTIFDAFLFAEHKKKQNLI